MKERRFAKQAKPSYLSPTSQCILSDFIQLKRRGERSFFSQGCVQIFLAKIGKMNIELRLEGANPHGDRTSLCLRKCRFRRYPRPIRNRPCRDAISITIDFSLRTAKPSLKAILIESTSFSSPQPPKAQEGRKREEKEYLSISFFVIL